MTSTSEPSVQSDQIAELVAKEEIRAVVMRYCRGVDRCDVDLIASVFHEDGQEERAGEIRFGRQAIADGLIQSLQRSMRSTSHNITTQNIAIRGDEAGVESYSIGQHIAKDGRRLNTQARYIDRFEKRDGVWKISRRLSISEITEFREQDARVEQVGESRRDETDPSYAVLPPSRQ